MQKVFVPYDMVLLKPSIDEVFIKVSWLCFRKIVSLGEAERRVQRNIPHSFCISCESKISSK